MYVLRKQNVNISLKQKSNIEATDCFIQSKNICFLCKKEINKLFLGNV